MAKHMISVCMFCFICATHSPCASHATIGHEKHYLHQYDANNPPRIENFDTPSREKLKNRSKSAPGIYDDLANVPVLHPANNIRNKRQSDSSDNSNVSNSEEDNYLRKIFLKYGDGDTMSLEGFEKLVEALNLLQVLRTSSELNDSSSSLDTRNTSRNITETAICKPTDLSSSSLLVQKAYDQINHTHLIEACPSILYNLIHRQCIGNTELNKETHRENTKTESAFFVWLYSTSAVFIISACGVLSLIIIPVMHNRCYKPLIQFLVALAVGTLAGDALLHLLPHAMSTMSDHHQHHHGEDSHGHGNHNENMWKGFVAMMGLTFFFIMEKIILFTGKWRKNRQKKHKSHGRVKVVNEGTTSHNSNDVAQCMDKYNSYPYCYKDIINDANALEFETATTALELGSGSDMQSIRKSRSPTIEKLETNQNMTECPSDLTVSTCTEINKMLPKNDKPNSIEVPDYTVILREHNTNHHGHSHTHNHVHSAPRDFSSVAWMVIMGDGLHNFTDGMAIGAAFSGGLAGGFSTAVAVFCHELPHELGDFAMLLKAGMTIKQALFYNLLSSVLCIFGNIFGVWLGNTEYASSWVFAAAAGMFIYIALVDMIPELSSAHEDESNLMQCVLHLSGLLSGFGIMMIIALYEHDLKTIFNESV